MLGELELVSLVAGIAGGIIILLLILLIILTIVICCLVTKRRKELDFYDKPDRGTKGSFEMSKYIQPSTAAHNVAFGVPDDMEPLLGNGDEG